MRFSPCSRFVPPRANRKAFTLVEVVVGLALMASVLVGALISFSAHRRQLRAADSKLEAVSVADDLLGRMSGSRDGVPRSGRGPISGRPGWFWQTRIVGIAAPAGIPLQVIRLEVIQVGADRTARVLTQVDIVESS
jgi:prepilin-type N-terminal cleavage/methylation domain-containing protein